MNGTLVETVDSSWIEALGFCGVGEGTDKAEVSQYPIGTTPDRNYRGFAFDFGAAALHEADADFRLAELGIGGGEAQVARQRILAEKATMPETAGRPAGASEEARPYVPTGAWERQPARRVVNG